LRSNHIKEDCGSVRRYARDALRFANKVGARLDRYAGSLTSRATSPLFVVGLPRSGTTLAYELIVQAFEVCYFSRIYNYTYGLPNLTTRFVSPLIRYPSARYQSDYGKIPGFLAPAENYNFWKKAFPERPILGHHVPAESLGVEVIAEINSSVASIEAIGRRPYVFKNVYFAVSIDSLLAAFDNGRVLVITRNIPAIVASLYRKRKMLQHKRNWWSIRPPFSEEIMAKPLIEQVTYQCIRSKQIMEAAIAQADPSRIMVADYEEICNQPQHFVARVEKWLEGSFRKRMNANIPDHFPVSESVEFCDTAQVLFTQSSSMLSADREKYLGRLADWVRKYSNSAESGLHSTDE